MVYLSPLPVFFRQFVSARGLIHTGSEKWRVSPRAFSSVLQDPERTILKEQIFQQHWLQKSFVKKKKFDENYSCINSQSHNSPHVSII